MKDQHCLVNVFKEGGIISCVITGDRGYSANLPQGGLEVPCSLVFSSNPSIVKKFRGVLSTSVKDLEVSESSVPPERKRAKFDVGMEKS